MSIPLLQTKLYAPPLRTKLIQRPLLTARLHSDQALHAPNNLAAERFNASELYPLTLIAAPAGFGKTTLVSEWIAQHQEPVAWLALDVDDNDIGRFLTYLLAALRTRGPADLGAGVLTLLQLPQPPPLRSLLTSLADVLSTALPPCVLVLDDYHVINAQAIHDTVLFLLEHAPNLRWIITTRADPPLPLGRLRARRQLLELRTPDLRFTPAETAQFFNEIMHIALPAEAVQTLAEHTEGWVTGLQLAALAIQSSPDRAAFIRDFSGSHRYVADYLVDEVLNHLSDQMQRFLLYTSIVERMCADLCDRLLGAAPIADHAAQTMLEELERANLFLIPLDDERRWYRYHHLFADLLRQRLRRYYPQLEGELHRRAAAWFEEQALIIEAVQHALACQAWDAAAALIERHGRFFMVKGEAQLVRDWLKALPKAVWQGYPYLHLLYAFEACFANELAAAEGHITAAEEQLDPKAQDERSRRGLGYATILRSGIARFRGDLVHCITLAERGLEILPAGDASGRMAATLHIAEAFLLSGDVSLASEKLLTAAVASARASGELANLFYASLALAGFQRIQGRLRQAATTYQEAAQVMPALNDLHALPNGANFYFGLGDILYEWNDLAAAENLLLQGQEIVREMRLAQAESVVWGYEGLARLQQARGQGQTALATLDELQRVAHRHEFAPHLRTRGLAGMARIALLQGDLATAVRWADERQLSLDNEWSYPYEQEHLMLARVRLAQGWRERNAALLAKVLGLLDQLLVQAEANSRIDSVIQILSLRALTLQVQGNVAIALATLARALHLAAPEGYLRMFVDEGESMRLLLVDFGFWLAQQPSTEQNRELHLYVDKVLAAFEHKPTPETKLLLTEQPPLPNAGEPLSARELELLHLMAAGLSNQEIADRLFITRGTVKSHANHIFGKLGVQGRVKAINRARELALI